MELNLSFGPAAKKPVVKSTVDASGKKLTSGGNQRPQKSRSAGGPHKPGKRGDRPVLDMQNELDDGEEGHGASGSHRHGEESMAEKRLRVKKIIENRRKHVKFTSIEGRNLKLEKDHEILGGELAPIENVFSETKFEDLGLEPGLLKSLARMEMATLTKVQLDIYDTLRERKNAIVRSVTGSGKTLAYMVPIMQDLLSLGTKITRQDGLYVVVLSPTRELAAQIYDVCIKLCSGCVNIVPGMFVGGEDINHEKSRLRKGINILVCTPARLLYHLDHSKNMSLNRLRTLVIEESDLSLSMGQGINVRQIVERIAEIKPDHFLQKVFTTACYDQRVRDLIEDCMRGNYELVGGLNTDDADKDLEKEEVLIPEQLKQYYVLVEENCKMSYLLSILYGLKEAKTIVFVSTADQANFLEKVFREVRHLPARKYEEHYKGSRGDDRYNKDALVELDKEKLILDTHVFKLHGHIDQDERLRVYKAFVKAEKGVLISTDVGSRGLDFPDVKLIVLFDPPESLAHYSNRVGRTARLTKAGSSLAFLHPAEDKFITVLSKRYQVKEFDPLRTFEAFEAHIPEHYPVGETIDYLNHALKKRVGTDNNLYFMARRAFNSFCRAYSRIKNKTVFNLKQLHLHNLAKGMGLKSAKSQDETQKEAYEDLEAPKKGPARETARQREQSSSQGGRGLKLRAKKDSAILKSEFL